MQSNTLPHTPRPQVVMAFDVALDGETDFTTGMPLQAGHDVVMVPTWDAAREAVWAVPCPSCHVIRGSLYFLYFSEESQSVACSKCGTTFQGIEV
jgi:hypothetical protein